jgi:hypothetical protein
MRPARDFSQGIRQRIPLPLQRAGISRAVGMARVDSGNVQAFDFTLGVGKLAFKGADEVGMKEIIPI